MTNRTFVAVSVLVMAAGVCVSAQRGTVRFAPPQPRSVRLIESFRPEARNEMKITGTILDIRRFAVPGQRVQLRDLYSGLIVREGVSDGAGNYEFTIPDAGIYAVEMVSALGQVVGLSNAGALTQYQTMSTIIQLPGRWDSARNSVLVPQSKMRFIGMSANTTMTATTIQFAANANVPPADPGEPVSP